MRPLLSGFIVCVIATAAAAAPNLDQSHPITQSTGGRIVYAGSAPAQSFTVGAAGLLSQIDVLLYRDAGDIGQLALEIWPIVAGGPAGSNPLYSTAIDPNLVSTGNASYVSVNVAAGGIGVWPGQKFAIALNGSVGIDAPNAVWSGGFPGYLNGNKFDRTGSWALNLSDTDYGFRTWVDPDYVPSDLNNLDMTPTSEWGASLSTSGASAIYSAGNTVRVDRSPSFDDDERGLFEFDASALPPDAVIRTAALEFEINQRSQSGAIVPRIEAYGYHADGSPGDAEARGLSRYLGTSPPINNFDPVTIPLNASQISSLHATSPDIGIVAYQAVATQGVNIVTTQLVDQQPSVYVPPTLSLGYTIESHPARSHHAGDFNRDARVDAADYTVWRDNLGTGDGSPADANNDGNVNAADRNIWAAQFGTTPDTQVANGNFQAGNLSEWNVVTAANTSVSFGFPTVESFDVDGDGAANSAFRVRLGRLDTSQFGGAVSIEQQLLLGAGDYQFTADVASQSLDTGGNTGPGNYELSFDGQVVDQVFLNGTMIDSMQVIRDSLSANLLNVAAGYHTLRLTVRRGALNSRPIYQFIDNIQFAPLGSASALAVPEPTTAALLALPLAAIATFRRRSSPTHSSC